jgi:hypothetical protein
MSPGSWYLSNIDDLTEIPKIAADYMLHIIPVGYNLQRLTMTVRLMSSGIATL